MDSAEATAPGGDAAFPGHSRRQVGERERRLEERERQVAERERKADEREHEADEREHEPQLRQHAVELRARAASVRERGAQAVEEAETVLDATRDRVRRAGAALNRAYASAARERTRVARLVKWGEQHPAPRQRDFTDLADRASALRKRTAAAAAQLANAEEHAARIYDEIAARDPGNPEHKRLADEAREAVRRARETERKYSSS